MGRLIRASAATRRGSSNREILVPLIEAVTRTRTTAQWVEALGPLGVPCGPINDIEQAFADPQVVARGLTLDQPTAPGSPVAVDLRRASPLRLSEHPPVVRNAPPALGEHTAEVLSHASASTLRRWPRCAKPASSDSRLRGA